MGTANIVVFKVGGEEYGIDVKDVVSIEKMAEITPIPNLPGYVRGVTRIREEVIPVFDLSTVFHEEKTAADGLARLILLRIGPYPCALLVKEAKELLEIETSQISRIDLIACRSTPYFSGIVHIQDRIITMIDAAKLIGALGGMENIQASIDEAGVKA
ncbi:MAG: chemotaxis protein CheW [Caldibacillus debilis]|jgi:purine-binding chemotaxis protein CheW|uniref:Chemotaxis signal transduction protein n=2 Tax=Caldibacillus debilis TaxID=301148 RepID=A0A420VEE9_9BACI|nr:chemotaxis protein CheW [Caldibacillus debilis]MBO2481548.1 chemotaxis protein CheW [Bacillaceae bacterium]KYD20142.1 hypothetical protein B4135_1917 [Caldibacillus debilis]MBY6272416.1 chemotaxis protein CheW [Bacillaceae bacterium]OUM83602.1 MAG: hypothetical protein BAA03_13520 [Caldibacillus debilis]REJ14182.1 MAG: chemotaxis protein CheW [Caldibacillus debilis]